MKSLGFKSLGLRETTPPKKLQKQAVAGSVLERGLVLHQGCIASSVELRRQAQRLRCLAIDESPVLVLLWPDAIP